MVRPIGKAEDIAVTLTRMATELTGAAARDLARDGDRSALVHGARRRLKAVRAILWALEPHVGVGMRRFRKRLAAAARELAGARDAHVIATAASGIGLADIADALADEADAARRADAPVRRAARDIASVSGALAELSAAFNGRKTLQVALHRSYRHGRRAMRVCRRAATTESLHAWRKLVKRLHALAELSQRKLPADAIRLVKRLDRLGDLLGLDHDYALLETRVAEEETAESEGRLRAIRDYRTKLQRQALKLGERVYARPPKEFTRHYRLRAERRKRKPIRS